MDTFYSLNAQVKATLATSELNTTEDRVDTNILLKIRQMSLVLACGAFTGAEPVGYDGLLVNLASTPVEVPTNLLTGCCLAAPP